MSELVWHLSDNTWSALLGLPYAVSKWANHVQYPLIYVRPYQCGQRFSMAIHSYSKEFSTGWLFDLITFGCRLNIICLVFLAFTRWMCEVRHSSGLLAASCIGFGSVFTNLLQPDFSGIFISVIVIVSYTVVSSMYFFCIFRCIYVANEYLPQCRPTFVPSGTDTHAKDALTYNSPIFKSIIHSIFVIAFHCFVIYIRRWDHISL